jgi:SPX domain protein involved in polyphosphate accumulation
MQVVILYTLKYSKEEITMEVKIEVKKLETDELVNILSGFYHYSNYWVENLDWNADFYQEVKEELKAKSSEEVVAFEEILAGILERKNDSRSHLKITDEDDVRVLTYDNIISGIQEAVNTYGVSLDPENWDAADADMIIQCALFSEVIYG